MEGIRVYIPDEKLIWIPATVLSVEEEGKRFRVRVDKVPLGLEDESEDEGQSLVDDERIVDLHENCMLESLPLQNGSTDFGNKRHTVIGVEDMCRLSHLHEAAIVYNLRTRFFAQSPYTYTGKIVVAVNPYTWIKDLYSDTLRELYTQKKRDELPPHVYATSAEAFYNMKHKKIPQSILVSGESGAGKTETVKIMMQHFASISVGYLQDKKQEKDSFGIQMSIVQKVLKSNPLLEAFGNAKTIRNDNSSRFGKFTQLQFNANDCLIGANCRHYLLEKSRVVAQSHGERNYHIFYQLLSAKENEFGFVSTSTPNDFRYLQDTEAAFLFDEQTDLERYQITKDALSTIGVNKKEQKKLFGALTGILRLGQLDFIPIEIEKDDACQLIASMSMKNFNNYPFANKKIDSQNKELEICAKLLGVEISALSQQLCRRTVKARQEIYCVPLSVTQASNNRDALAKELYARLFAYLVARVNDSISCNDDSCISKMQHIDLLDIFGFESFETNRFEQFCINFANEKLQQRFTQDVFKIVQEEYKKEQIDWKMITFQDNQDMLDLLESPMGLMALLNEECVRPMGSDASFASKIVSLHESHPRLEKARLSQTHFVLYHYAGCVTYDSYGFVEKNKDALQTDLLDLLANSKNEVIADVFNDTFGLLSDDFASPAIDATSIGSGDDRRSSTVVRKGATFMQETVSYKFKAQLTLLMNDISATEVHYVRCIKPNSIKSNKTFELSSVVHQLRCAGVVEAIRITRAAFPNKMSHERFLRRFVLMKSSTNQKTSAKNVTTVSSACIELAQQLLKDSKLPPSLNGVPNYVVGKTLIYFGKDVLEYFEQKRTLFVHNRAILIQCVAKAWITRRHFKRYRAMIIKLQALHRRNLQRKVFISIRAKAILTQSIWRGYATRCGIYLKYREHMAIRIQSFVRQDQANKRYTRFRNAIIKIQSKMKMKKQVNKYQVLRKEKKEQEIMENEVELLKQRLEEEKIARLEIEAQNNSLQQELQEARVTMQILPPIPSQTEENNRKSFVSNRSSKTSEHDDAKLLDDSERMIDYFRKEWNKSREMVTSLTQENENLKAENKKVKEAYAAAGASFAALNQHNKQQSKANLRLMSTHAALIKSQEEKMKKYQKQITDLKEELRIQKNVYSNELTARMHQQDLLKEIVHLAESHGVAEEIVAKLRAMTTTKIGSSNLPVNIRSGSTGRTDTISSSMPPMMNRSISSPTSTATSIPVRASRSTTLDVVTSYTPRETSNERFHYERQSLAQGRPSLYDDESKHRKSLIGGMFKKIFKKDDNS